MAASVREFPGVSAAPGKGALQGPKAAEVFARLAPASVEMGFMSWKIIDVAGIPCFVSRSGYTGEDGNVVLNSVFNAGSSEIVTSDGNIDIFGQASKLGRIVPNIKGDGNVHGSLDVYPAAPGELKITTQDGNITVH